jgi:D-alanyl-D-alanine carboxypeptidase
MKRVALYFAVLCIACGPAHAAASTLSAAQTLALQHALDAARAKSGTPGTSATIMMDGRMLWTGTSGVVDLRSKEPVTSETMFILASVSKLFTDAIVLRLSEQGRLRLDDPIDRYLPVHIPDDTVVTVRELLGHTSGYPDDEGLMPIDGWLNDPNFLWSRDLLIERETKPSFAPGTKFSYCNSCFVMLGAVIESASRSTVAAQFSSLIARPLGLSNEIDMAPSAQFAARLSRGYDLHKGNLVDTFEGARKLFGVPTYDWGPVWTDGGVAATATGVAAFTDALFDGRVLESATLAEMLKTGPDHDHGLDAETYDFDHHAWRGHSGFFTGFTAESWYDASRKLTITVLANRTDGADPATEIWNALARAYDVRR